MNNHALSILGSIALLSLTLGCSEDIDSEDVRTSGLYAEFQALATGNGSTEVTARLKTGGSKSNTFADLTGDDTLIASADDDTDTMVRKGSGNRDPYEARFDTQEGGTKIGVAFERGEQDDSAPDSEVTLPEPFTLEFSDIDSGDEVERGSDIKIKWTDNSSGTIDWSVEGDCIWDESGSTGDDGSFTISAESIRVQALDEGEDCDVTITLERTNDGDVDSAFDGGKFQAIQRRRILFTSTPAPGEDGTGGAGGSN